MQNILAKRACGWEEEKLSIKKQVGKFMASERK